VKHWNGRFIGLLSFLLLFGLLMLPASALAAHESDDGSGGTTFQVNGPVHIASGQQANTVIVIKGTATVEGTVHNSLFVVGGDAVVDGMVDGDLTVINGRAVLGGGSRVHNLMLINSTSTRVAGATVTGSINSRSTYLTGWPIARFISLTFWASISALLLVFALAFVAIAGRQLSMTRRAINEHPGETVAAAAVIGIGVPVLIVASFVTIIGIPVGLALIAGIAVLSLFGYLVVADAIGVGFLRALGQSVRVDEARPYLPVALGVVVLRLISLVPVLGTLATITASLVGAGALSYLIWRGRHGPQTSNSPTNPGSPERPVPMT